jgi:hypothetical protein
LPKFAGNNKLGAAIIYIQKLKIYKNLNKKMKENVID